MATPATPGAATDTGGTAPVTPIPLRTPPPPPPEPTISVVISAHNAQATLPDQLRALTAQTYTDPWELIVVDNASTDDTLAIALDWQRTTPHLRVTTAPWHISAGHGRNVGARLARGRLLLFCDADDIVCPDWITALSAALRTFDLVGGHIDRDQLNAPHTRAARPGTGTGLLDGFAFLPYASAANLGIRRDLYRRISGFDEKLTRGQDIDLCWRAQLAGGRLGHAPDAVVHYRLRPTLAAALRQLYGFGRAHTILYRRYRRLGHATVSRHHLLTRRRLARGPSPRATRAALPNRDIHPLRDPGLPRWQSDRQRHQPSLLPVTGDHPRAHHTATRHRSPRHRPCRRPSPLPRRGHHPLPHPLPPRHHHPALGERFLRYLLQRLPR